MPAVAGIEIALQAFELVLLGAGERCPAHQLHVTPVPQADRAEALGHHLANRALEVGGYLLRQPGGAQPAAADDPAVVRHDQSRENLQQCRLARAVAPHQGDALAGADLPVDAGEQGRLAQGQMDLVQLQQQGRGSVGWQRGSSMARGF
jgi:hypothetical protein